MTMIQTMFLRVMMTMMMMTSSQMPKDLVTKRRKSWRALEPSTSRKKVKFDKKDPKVVAVGRTTAEVGAIGSANGPKDWVYFPEDRPAGVPEGWSHIVGDLPPSSFPSEELIAKKKTLTTVGSDGNLILVGRQFKQTDYKKWVKNLEELRTVMCNRSFWWMKILWTFIYLINSVVAEEGLKGLTKPPRVPPKEWLKVYQPMVDSLVQYICGSDFGEPSARSEYPVPGLSTMESSIHDGIRHWFVTKGMYKTFKDCPTTLSKCIQKVLWTASRAGVPIGIEVWGLKDRFKFTQTPGEVTDENED